MKSKILIISDIGKEIGLGHYTRSRIIKKEINSFFKNSFLIKNIYFDNEINKKKILKIKTVSNFESLKKKTSEFKPNFVFLNNSKKFEKNFANKILNFLKKNFKNTIIVSVDSYISYHNKINHIWIPNVEINNKYKFKKNIYFGWDKLLIQKNKKRKITTKNNLLISTGSADKYGLIKKIPKYFKTLTDDLNIHCLIGPYSKIPKNKNKFKIKYLTNVKNTNLLNKFNFGFVTFGVSFFEFIFNNILVIAYIPQKKEKPLLVRYLRKKGFIVCTDNRSILDSLKKLLKNKKEYQKRIKLVSKKINFKNRKIFYKKLLYNLG